MKEKQQKIERKIWQKKKFEKSFFFLFWQQIKDKKCKNIL
jgi:hypothetical protein